MKVELREITSRSRNRDSSVMMSSVRPSAKNSCSGSPLMLSSGSTAIDGFLAVVAAAAEVGEGDVLEAIGELVAHRAGDADAARLGQRLEARGDVDAVAEDVAVLVD